MKKLLWLLPVFALLFAWPGHSQTKSHSIALTWVSGAGDVSFNVYRGTVSGGPYTKLTATPLTSVGYTDTTGAGGTKYFYVVTGLDSTGVESVNSNEASATFLAPPAVPTGLQAVSN